jgi:hypothetical protein
MLAEANPELVFTSLAHRIDLSLLRKSFRQLRKNESTGVDKITAKQYTENLDENSIICISECGCCGIGAKKIGMILFLKLLG